MLSSVAAVSGCTDTARVFPMDQAAAQAGVPKVEFVRQGIGRGPVTITMPDGEVLKGEYQVTENAAVGIGIAGTHVATGVAYGSGRHVVSATGEPGTGANSHGRCSKGRSRWRTNSDGSRRNCQAPGRLCADLGNQRPVETHRTIGKGVSEMTRSLEGRLARLEAASGAGKEIIIWCDQGDEFEARVAEMTESGEIKASDRVHCVHWLRAQGQPGEHERSLEELD
jgi:hypothetical protein